MGGIACPAHLLNLQTHVEDLLVGGLMGGMVNG